MTMQDNGALRRVDIKYLNTRKLNPYDLIFEKRKIDYCLNTELMAQKHITLWLWHLHEHIDKLMQERRNASALATELHLSCTNP